MSEKDYRVWFAGAQIPTFEAWGKLEIANRALEVLKHFNARRQQLSTDLTRRTEDVVRKRLAGIEVLVPERPPQDDTLATEARALLLRHAPEEVLEILRRDHKVDCDLNGLIFLAGPETYLASLTHEAEILVRNAVSVDQIAGLWNEAKRPVPGKPFWDVAAVRALLKAGQGPGET
jgi:hypothetical protein